MKFVLSTFNVSLLALIYLFKPAKTSSMQIWKQSISGCEIIIILVSSAKITETKNKAKSSKELNEYVMFYSEVDIKKRASAGVALLVNKSWKNKIHSYTYIDERIVTV
jgi:hypothetical protein